MLRKLVAFPARRSNFQSLPKLLSGNSDKGLLASLTRHVQMEMEKNKELKENLKKLRRETERLEQSDALKQARKKFDLVEKETYKSSERLRQHLVELQTYMGKSFEEAKKSPIGQKGIEVSKNVYSTAREALGTLEDSVDVLSKTAAYRNLSIGVKYARDEFDQFAFADGWVYKDIEVLKKRTDHAWMNANQVIMENHDATSVSVHKDERWYSSFKTWTDSNPYFKRLINLKAQYEESENPVIMVTRLVSNKVSSTFRDLLYNSSISEVVTEICKVDPTFDMAKFCTSCQTEIIPNVLEASFRRELDVVKDWCSEMAYAQLTHLFTECARTGYLINAKLLDVGSCEVILGKMTQFGPLLLVSFSTHQIRHITNLQGESMFQTSDTPVSISYIWAFCRDPEEFNPKAAWKIMEVGELPAKKTV